MDPFHRTRDINGYVSPRPGQPCFVVEITCGVPPQLEDGDVNAFTMVFNSEADYTCLEGYSMSRSDGTVLTRATTTCTGTGYWSELNSHCTGKVHMHFNTRIICSNSIGNI